MWKSKRMSNKGKAQSEEPLGVLLVTANVGTLFEQPATFQEPWLSQLYQLVKEKNPDFIAIHCQEVGGKTYETRMGEVNVFVKRLMNSDELKEFNCVRGYLDEDYEEKPHFTALGSIFFIHESVKDATMWNFSGSRFHPVAGKEVKSSDLRKNEYHEKLKFPPDFFPQFPWSRKGFIRTRWRMRNKTFDMVNVHLFHDACNLEASRQSPSIYVANRKRALTHTLAKLKATGLEDVPLFVFGDFNFRLDLRGVVNKFFGEPQHQQQEDGTVVRSVYLKPGDDKPMLTVARKLFAVDKSFSIKDHAEELKKFDFERDSFPELLEQDVKFQPSYPFSEEEDDIHGYMSTRCPGWCDRVLYNHLAGDVLKNAKGVTYDLVGLDVCMGDHKPVALSFQWPGSEMPEEIIGHTSKDNSLRSSQTASSDDVAARQSLRNWYFGATLLLIAILLSVLIETGLSSLSIVVALLAGSAGLVLLFQSDMWR